MSMPIRVIFADLDGTLLNKAHAVSAFTRAVLHRLHVERPDVKFVVATGRPYQYVMELMKLLNLHPDYIISNNGAVVHQGETDARICQHALSPNLVRRLLAVPLPCESDKTTSSGARPTATVPTSSVVAANLFREEDWLATYKVRGLGSSYSPTFQPRIVHDLSQSPNLHQQVYSVFFYGPHEHLTPIEDILKRDFTNEITYSFSIPFILDVAPPAVDKGTAIRDVLQLLHLATDDAAAFGDAMNDLPMLRAVRHGYLMANSLPELLAAAPDMEIIRSHEEDGVAQKLNELFFT